MTSPVGPDPSAPEPARSGRASHAHAARPAAAGSTGQDRAAASPRPARSRRHAGAGGTPRWLSWWVPGLLAVALALLVVGLMRSSALWLALSLAASLVAAGLLAAERFLPHRASARTASPAARPDVTQAPAAPTPPVAPRPVPTPPDDRAVADRPGADRPVPAAPAPAATPGGGGATRTAGPRPGPGLGDTGLGDTGSAADPGAVWVVDGRPRYHLRDCPTIASLPAEPVDRDQAVADGFVACSLCEPGHAAGAHAAHG